MSNSRLVPESGSQSRPSAETDDANATESRPAAERTDLVGNTQRISNLTDSLTALSSLMSRHRELEPVPVAEVVHEVQEDISTDDATVRLEGTPEIVADREWTELALQVLISNAVCHGGPAVTIRVGVDDDVLYVADDGPGIPIDRRDDVVRSGYSTDESGAGYGLTVAVQVARAHDWGLRFRESDEGGTRVELQLQ